MVRDRLHGFLGRTRRSATLHELLEQDPKNTLVKGAFGYALARSGDTPEARKVLGSLEQASSHARRVPHYAIAIIRMALDRRTDAIRSLQRSFAVGSLASLGFALDPLLVPLRNDPEFRAFVQVSYPLNQPFLC